MGFSHLFVLQLRSWPSWSRTSWFGLRTSLAFWSLTFNICGPLTSYFSICWPLTSYLYLYIPRPPWAFRGDVTSWHPRSSYALLRSRHLPVPCMADTYQYPLQSQHLLVHFAKPTPTSTLAEPTPTSTYCKVIIYQYPMIRDNAQYSTKYPMIRDDAQHSTRYRLQHSTRCRLQYNTRYRLQHSTRWRLQHSTRWRLRGNVTLSPFA